LCDIANILLRATAVSAGTAESAY